MRDSKTMTIEEIKAKLDGLNLAEVSRLTGVDYAVLWRIANGRTVKPWFEDVQRIIKFLEEK
jgi:transcriptional regulator with XRE-family HTH domain